MHIHDKYEVASFQDIGGRKEQQDRVAILWQDEACLIILADGLGGHAHGAFAAQTAVDVADEVFSADPRAAAAELFDTIVTTAHQRMYARVPRKLSRSSTAYPGTTCVLLHLDRDKATWTHLGDSRLYWYQGGHSVEHTVDHAFPEGGMSACLGGGIGTLPPLDIGTAELTIRDSLLLCSDGLWENMPDPDSDAHYMGDALQRHGVSAGVRQLGRRPVPEEGITATTFRQRRFVSSQMNNRNRESPIPSSQPLPAGSVLCLDIDGVCSPIGQNLRFHCEAPHAGFVPLANQPVVQVHPALPTWAAELADAYDHVAWISTWNTRCARFAVDAGMTFAADWPYLPGQVPTSRGRLPGTATF